MAKRVCPYPPPHTHTSLRTSTPPPAIINRHPNARNNKVCDVSCVLWQACRMATAAALAVAWRRRRRRWSLRCSMSPCPRNAWACAWLPAVRRRVGRRDLDGPDRGRGPMCMDGLTPPPPHKPLPTHTQGHTSPRPHPKTRPPHNVQGLPSPPTSSPRLLAAFQADPHSPSCPATVPASPLVTVGGPVLVDRVTEADLDVCSGGGDVSLRTVRAVHAAAVRTSGGSLQGCVSFGAVVLRTLRRCTRPAACCRCVWGRGGGGRFVWGSEHVSLGAVVLRTLRGRARGSLTLRTRASVDPLSSPRFPMSLAPLRAITTALRCGPSRSTPRRCAGPCAWAAGHWSLIPISGSQALPPPPPAPSSVLRAACMNWRTCCGAQTYCGVFALCTESTASSCLKEATVTTVKFKTSVTHPVLWTAFSHFWKMAGGGHRGRLKPVVHLVWMLAAPSGSTPFLSGRVAAVAALADVLAMQFVCVHVATPPLGWLGRSSSARMQISPPGRKQRAVPVACAERGDQRRARESVDIDPPLLGCKAVAKTQARGGEVSGAEVTLDVGGGTVSVKKLVAGNATVRGVGMKDGWTRRGVDHGSACKAGP
eukprot:351280-Chlamydomonas_euryale.AAC.1